MWSVPSLYKKQWRLFEGILQEDVVQGSSVVNVFSMWSVPSLYKKQWRLCERIRQEDVVLDSSVVDVFSMWSVPSLYKKRWRLCERIRQEDVVQGSSVVDVLTLRVLQLLVCHSYSNLESVITNCSYDVWNYPINRVIKSGTHYLLSRYQDTRDNTKYVGYLKMILWYAI
jgi:hypothetical protein